MLNLRIIDVSCILHTANNSNKYKDCNQYLVPTGGIHMLNRQIAIALAETDTLLLAFDSKNNYRKTIMPEYKKGRSFNRVIEVQNELIYEYYSKAGIGCNRLETYEADDIIHWGCCDTDLYDKVLLIGNDKDLVINVHDNVVFRPVSGDGSVIISEANYSDAFRSYANRIPFNFVGPYKVLFGDSSDYIPAFKSSTGMSNLHFFTKIVETYRNLGLSGDWSYLVSKEVFNIAVSSLGIPQEEKDILKVRAEVIFPREKPDSFEVLRVVKNKIDFNAFANFLRLVGDKDTLRNMNLSSQGSLCDSEINKMKKKGKEFANGRFAIDNSLPVYDSLPDMNVFQRGYLDE